MADPILPVARVWFPSVIPPLHAQLATALEQIVEPGQQTPWGKISASTPDGEAMPFVIRLTALNESYYWNDKANAFGPRNKASIYPGTQAAPQELVVGNLRGGFTVLDRTIKDGSTLYEDGEDGKRIELVPAGGDLDGI
jgi:hypothetical protein